MVDEKTSHPFHRQRLETLGVLAGGIAHDFNNMLAGILGHVTYLKTILPAAGEHSESLKAVEDGARRASQMTQQILDFSKLDTEKRPVSIDLCEVAQGSLRLLKGATDPGIELSLSHPDEPIYILGVEGQLAQVIVNLVINARDAVEQRLCHGGGKIEISVRRVDDNETLLKVFSSEELSAPEYAVLCVSDNGHGMPEELIEKVFEPYFSTKGHGRDVATSASSGTTSSGSGTGLGLATVRSIVEELAGGIDLRSEVGKGTEVFIYLPTFSTSVTTGRSDVVVSETVKPADLTGKLVGGKERILVIDDESSVRNVLTVSLRHLGYDVDGVSSGVEALDLYEQSGERYDLVILDMLMPRFSGDEIYRRLQAVDPDVRVLVISGYSSEEAVQRILQNGGLGFIQKPFTIDELSMRVRDALDLKMDSDAHRQ